MYIPFDSAESDSAPLPAFAKASTGAEALANRSAGRQGIKFGLLRWVLVRWVLAGEALAVYGM